MKNEEVKIEKWKQFVADINDKLKLEPPYSVEGTEEEAIAEITARQDGEDAFVDEDYVPSNNIGLKNSTVAWLAKNDVDIPLKWIARLKKQAEVAVKEEVEDTVAIKEAPSTKKEKVEKKEKEKVEKKEKKASPQKAKNVLGHLIGSGADQLDNLFLAGTTVQQLEEKGFSLGRVKSHYKHLDTEKSDLVKVTWEGDNIEAEMLAKGE